MDNSALCDRKRKRSSTGRARMKRNPFTLARATRQKDARWNKSIRIQLNCLKAELRRFLMTRI